MNLAALISGGPALLLSLVCENFMWPSVTFTVVYGALASSLVVLFMHARRGGDYV